MEIANSSLLDEATAAAEAMTFCQKIEQEPQQDLFRLSRTAILRLFEVLRTRAQPVGIDIIVGDHREDLDGLEIFGVLLP